jgi:hypothetical protein
MNKYSNFFPGKLKVDYFMKLDYCVHNKWKKWTVVLRSYKLETVY